MKIRKRRPCRNLENVHNEESLQVMSFGREPSIKKKSLQLLFYYLHSFNSHKRLFFIYNDIYVNFSTFGNDDMKLLKRHVIFLSLILKFEASKENEGSKRKSSFSGLCFRVFVFGSQVFVFAITRAKARNVSLVSFRSGNKSPRLLSHGKIKGTTLPATLNSEVTTTSTRALKICVLNKKAITQLLFFNV